MNKNPLSLLMHFIGSVFTALFGRVQWNSPAWLAYLQEKSTSKPKLFWGCTIGLLLLLCIASYVVYWFSTLPKPVYTTASVIVPDVSANEDPLVPNNLTINFGIQNNEFTLKSVAPLNLVGKPITQGLDMSPQVPGTWTWNTDSQLVFTPEQDWPANQKYTIHFSPNFFAANANMDKDSVSFTTKPFQATVKEFKFYQNPVDAEDRYAVATIVFNYPVNTEILEKDTNLYFQTQKNETLEHSGRHLKFSYTFDQNKRTAYLHSEKITIEKEARYLVLTLDNNISSSTNSGELGEELSQNILIPDASNFLKVTSASAAIIRNDKDRPEQVLTVETTLGINENQFNQHVHVYLLPVDRPATAAEPLKTNYTWQNPGEVTPSILKLATPLSKTEIPSEQNYSTLHSFKFSAQTPRYLFISIDKGMKGFGDFSLSTDYSAVIPVPEYPKEISFMHKGSLLALGGEKKLSVLIRGVAAVKFNFSRVLPENINQLVTQTQGDFNNPYFINPSFNQQNISQIFSETRQFQSSDLTQQQYTALDLGKYLATNSNTSGPQGLFLLQATGWDEANNTALDVKASRLILVTDMGMIVKDNQDSSHDVFVSSITQGTPISGAVVTVLGKNGLPILSKTTDDQGRANFPSLKDFLEDKEPVVYIAALNNDVSFIPFNNYNRQLNFSKFDTGGLYTDSELSHLSAFVFSDRGIYRPGDTVHIGMIVKQAYAQAQPAGLPLQATVVDSRGTTIKDEKITLNDSGYMELDFATNETSPTGQYTVSLYLVKDGYTQNIIGSTEVKISEFQPDRMKISSTLTPILAKGWNSPLGMKAHITLLNLYGSPATNRKVSAKIVLSPQKVKFDNYPDYVFADPLFDPKKPPKSFNETLTSTTTNIKGDTEFNLNLERFEKATYQLTFFAEGFEAEGGRSVTTQTKTLISPLPYFVGYKTDGDLSFIKQMGQRSVHFIAINPDLNKEALDDLKIQLISLKPVTTLVKKSDGTYQYQSITQSEVVSTQPFTIMDNGTNYSLPTDQIGDYAIHILDKDNTVLSQFNFSIVGASQKPLARNAELSMKLNKEEYLPGDNIEIQITAPYTGSGLITIERDKVYATQWFKTQTPSSVQTIQVPADFQGNGYINVAFIRDWNSEELFISPLSYSVEPFSINTDAHDIQIDLKTPEVVHPGEQLTINYHTDKAGKIIVFAVDEGILQVARYETPDPLSFFFQKHALEVLTQQTVDQILPQFIQDRELSAAGGDESEAGMASRLNPFKRKTDLPVVYWSGIIDTDTTDKQLQFHVPDYFNGSIKIMGVAVSADSVGSNDSITKVRGDFIISPNVPTFVAPGDEFEISSSIANNLKDSADHTPITISITTSPELEIVGDSSQVEEIKEGQEEAVRFKLRAKSILGAAKVTFTAQAEGKSATMDASLSVRPASPLITYIDSGLSQDERKTLDVLKTLYPEFRKANATVSTSPLILVFGLQRYLNNFPYGCTEQLTSKALPLIAMNSQSMFSKDTEEINKKMNATIQALSQRQMSNGGFSYWPGFGVNNGNDFSSVYAMHFLTEARNQGFNVPNQLFYNGINFLKELASQDASSLETARIRAYAIYVLTRNELVTTNYLANLQLYLQKDSNKAWQKDITAAYIASSYQLLKSYDEANKLIRLYQPQDKTQYDSDFYDPQIANAQYLYLLSKHFPDLIAQRGNALMLELVKSINSSEINTLLSGYSSLALAAYPQTDTAKALSSLSISEIPSGQTQDKQEVDIGTQVEQITFNNPEKQTFFYQLLQSGFNKVLPQSPQNQGIEIYREYTDDKGKAIQSAALGDEIVVHLHIRALEGDYLSNIVIEDLLPGGFEVVRDSIKTDYLDFVDVREDRVNFFGSIDSNVKEIIYKIKATNPGKFVVPPAFAESMYNPGIKSIGAASEIIIK